jgi:hypothetical protein
MARPTGFEPVTPAFGGQYSIQLSYGRIFLGALSVPERLLARTCPASAGMPGVNEADSQILEIPCIARAQRQIRRGSRRGDLQVQGRSRTALAFAAGAQPAPSQRLPLTEIQQPACELLSDVHVQPGLEPRAP